MTTLREQIARRLAVSCWKTSSTARHEEDFAPSECWLAVADEVIRLMEWARREMHGRIQDYTQNAFDDGGALPGPDRPEGNLPLTLPPPEWKP